MAHPTLYGYTACECIVASAPLVELRLREAGLIAHSLSGLISQGCYSAGAVAASAGTHDGGGVWDIKDFTPYRADLDNLLTACGWIDFYRLYGQLYAGSPAHHHVVLNGCPHLAAGARSQLTEALAGRNGLAGKGKDSGPRPGITWQQAVAADGGATQTTITQEDDDMLHFTDSRGTVWLGTATRVVATGSLVEASAVGKATASGVLTDAEIAALKDVQARLREPAFAVVVDQNGTQYVIGPNGPIVLHTPDQTTSVSALHDGATVTSSQTTTAAQILAQGPVVATQVTATVDVAAVAKAVVTEYATHFTN